MLHAESFGLLIGAVVLGLVHGIEPGHGWPVAASYALDRTNRWVYGFAASLVLGIGHLTSSIAMVMAFFYAKEYFNLTRANQPITIPGGFQIGGAVSIVAGLLLVALGIREYFNGHSHGGHGDDHSHDSGHPHGDAHDHGRSRRQSDSGIIPRLKGFVPFVGGHAHDTLDEPADRGIFGIVWFGFVLGFAHQEEFEIIALCAGSNYCLELMSAYALTVIVSIVGLTMLLIAGYQHYEQKVERYTPYLPAFSAAVLVVIGIGFVTGLL